jgi:hypothetical protein
MEGHEFYWLEPTLSMDYAPNNQGKVYNTLRLNYIKDEKTGKMLDYAQARCMVQIPKLVKINKKKPSTLPDGNGVTSATTTEQDVVEQDVLKTEKTEPDQESVESCHSHDEIDELRRPM